MHSTCPLTRECLKELGKKCQTYDQIINHLIERRKGRTGSSFDQRSKSIEPGVDTE
jgi:hypothetical protein